MDILDIVVCNQFGQTDASFFVSPNMFNDDFETRQFIINRWKDEDHFDIHIRQDPFEK